MPNNLSDLILKVLSENVDKHFTLEELTSMVRPLDDKNNIDIQRLNQVEVLEQLLVLDCQGLLELNPDTDQSFIKAQNLNKKISQLQISSKSAK